MIEALPHWSFWHLTKGRQKRCSLLAGMGNGSRLKLRERGQSPESAAPKC